MFAILFTAKCIMVSKGGCAEMCYLKLTRLFECLLLDLNEFIILMRF